MSKAVARAQEVEIQEEIDEDELMLSLREERSRLLCLGLERVLVLGVTLVEDSETTESLCDSIFKGLHHERVREQPSDDSGLSNSRVG